jgi:signal peptidase I
MFGTESYEQKQTFATRLLGPKNHKTRLIREWVVIVAVALVASIVIRSYVFQTFYIPSGSMEPTLMIGDRIVVDKLSVDFGSINRGDIVVFRAPPAENCGGEPVTDLVKRVIGVPGDTLSSKGNTILVNGKPLKEAWSHWEPLGPAINPTTVKPGNYFVMGDNHNNSCDSRYWGTVPKSLIIGKAFVRIWPFNRIGWF